MTTTTTNNNPPKPSVWRKLGVALIAVLLCGGIMYTRVHKLAAGGTAMERAISALQRAGAEIQDREIPPGVLTGLEPHPALGSAVGGDLLAQAIALKPLVVLNFWATWCPPCIDELASMRQLARNLAAVNAQVVAVSYDEGWAEQKAALLRHLGSEMPTPILWARDPEGQDGEERQMMRIRFGTTKLPETYVIAKGRIIARFVGEQDWTQTEIGRELQLTAEAAQ